MTTLERALEAVRGGGVVAAPTDTLVGLLAHATNPEAVARVFAIKGEGRRSPLPVLLPDRESLEKVSTGLPPSAIELVERGWPGPLTLIVPAKVDVLPSQLLAGRDTVAVRIPGPSPAYELLQAFTEPLTGTSANLTGKPGVASSDELDPAIAKAVDVVLPGVGAIGVASTIVDVTGDELKVLRGDLRL